MQNYTTAQQDAKLAQARALLAKAESTVFAAEAEALTSKANELIAQYGLDAAKAYALDATTDELTVKTLTVGGGYALRQAALLANIAKPLRVRAIRFGTGKKFEVRIYGFRSDVERTELLFTSLLLQVQNAIAHTEVPSWENGRTFRTNFWNAFIVTIAERLTTIEAQAQAAETRESGSSSTALVLVDRTAQVEHYVATEVGKTRSSSSRSRHSHAGATAGQQAGQRADIGQTRVGTRRTALTG